MPLLSEIDPRFLLITGTTLSILGAIFFFLKLARQPAPGSPHSFRRHPLVFLLLMTILLPGAALRFWKLDEKSITHPEVVIPGIPMPPISAPPPRITLLQTASFHFHVEPHPPGFYYMMWCWIKLFGSSLFSLRIPSVLFGTASILLIFLVARKQYSIPVALISAALLAFNGHHVFWSQTARIYTTVTFWGLASVLFLNRMVTEKSNRLRDEILFVGFNVLGVWTELLYWPLLVAQMIWIALRTISRERQMRILSLQVLVILIGAPALAHAAYQARPSHLESFSFRFMNEYLTFGFLLRPDSFPMESVALPSLTTVAALLIGVACICIGIFVKTSTGPESAGDAGGNPPGMVLLAPVTIGSMLVIVGFSLLARHRQEQTAMTAVIPPLALFLPLILSTSGRFLNRFPRLHSVLTSIPMFGMLSFLPLLLVCAISFLVPLFASRVFLVFVPYLLIVIAAGILKMATNRLRLIFFAVVLSVIHVASIVHFHNALSTPIEYQGMANEIGKRYQAGDLIFVHANSWKVTPLFYCIRNDKANFVWQGFGGAVATHHEARAYVIELPKQAATRQMRMALRGFQLKETIVQLRLRCRVYQRPDAVSE